MIHVVTKGTDYNLAVAAELRAERAAKQITIAQLAEQSGLVRGSLLRYLNGQREIPVPALFHIAEALNVQPKVIMERASKRMSS